MKPSPTFEAIAETYRRDYRRNRRPRSVGRHEMASRALKPFFVGKRVEGITPLLIQRCKRECKAQKRRDVTLDRELAFLKDLFIRAITSGKRRRTRSSRCVCSEKITPELAS
jgi:hypothetical protein